MVYRLTDEYVCFIKGMQYVHVCFLLSLTDLFSFSLLFLFVVFFFCLHEMNQQKLSGSCGMLIDSVHDTPIAGARVSHNYTLHATAKYYAHAVAKTMNILIA